MDVHHQKRHPPNDAVTEKDCVGYLSLNQYYIVCERTVWSCTNHLDQSRVIVLKECMDGSYHSRCFYLLITFILKECSFYCKAEQNACI